MEGSATQRPAGTALINEKEANEQQGISDRKYLTCEKYGDVFEVRDWLACLQPKVTCKFRLDCPIHQIGLMD